MSPYRATGHPSGGGKHEFANDALAVVCGDDTPPSLRAGEATATPRARTQLARNHRRYRQRDRGGVKKLEASYNIVTANEEEIRQANPKSTADLLKISPGLWPESTGGQTGANIEIAGFPGGGDAPYFTTQLMGSPLYGMPTMSFFETTSIFRLDDTVRSVEILQGGPSVVFAGGQMGATANFLLKTGSEEPTGSLALTYGDENLWRVDGFSGFKVGEGWYGSVGGFWRTSDGVRDPQFSADEGGQLTATLKRESDAGELILYARYLDDKNQFITPIPVIQRGTRQFQRLSGLRSAHLDLLQQSHSARAARRLSERRHRTRISPNGRGAQMVFLGANYDHEFGNGWSISDKFLFNARRRRYQRAVLGQQSRHAVR